MTGTSIGKGFAGGMKRHNFGGLRATHGVSVVAPQPRLDRAAADPGKTFKNKKMAGHMGNERVTTQSLEVVAADAERGLLLIKGSVPGSENGWVLSSRTRSSASRRTGCRSRRRCAARPTARPRARPPTPAAEAGEEAAP